MPSTSNMLTKRIFFAQKNRFIINDQSTREPLFLALSVSFFSNLMVVGFIIYFRCFSFFFSYALTTAWKNSINKQKERGIQSSKWRRNCAFVRDKQQTTIILCCCWVFTKQQEKNVNKKNVFLCLDFAERIEEALERRTKRTFSE